MIDAAEKEGLVHCTYNLEHDQMFVCNCCSCCCGAMQAWQNGTPMLASSGYEGDVEPAACVGCGASRGDCERTVKHVGLFTTFFEAESGYSLIAVASTQLQALIDHGYDPAVLVQDNFTESEPPPNKAPAKAPRPPVARGLLAIAVPCPPIMPLAASIKPPNRPPPPLAAPPSICSSIPPD